MLRRLFLLGSDDALLFGVLQLLDALIRWQVYRASCRRVHHLRCQLLLPTCVGDRLFTAEDFEHQLALEFACELLSRLHTSIAFAAPLSLAP